MTDQELISEMTRVLVDKTAPLSERQTALEDRLRRFMESRAAGPVGGGHSFHRPETLAAAFLKSDVYRLFKETKQKRSGEFTWIPPERKAVTPIAEPVTFPIIPGRVPDVANTYPGLVLHDLLNPQPIRETGAISYVRQKPSTGAAGIQWPQGATKAELSMSFESAQANVATIAAYTKASRQVLEDDAQVEAIIEGELQYQVGLSEEGEILNGDGSAGHMQGLLTIVPAFAGGVAGDTPVDVLGKAVGQVAALGFPVTGICLNPADWTAIGLLKNAQEEYLIGNPGAGQTAPFLWNTRVALCATLAQGTFLLGAFGTAAQLYVASTRLEIALENEDDFIKNLATFLGEIRSALVIRRPPGFLKGSLTVSAQAAASSKK